MFLVILISYVQRKMKSAATGMGFVRGEDEGNQCRESTDDPIPHFLFR
jgi:hypothetical protein